jgi:TonB family protein
MSCCVAVLFALGSIVPVTTFPNGTETTDSEFAPPRVIAASQAVPTYPPAALAGRFEGVVELRATVRADGTVRSVDVLWCDHPQLGFEAASAEAVRFWRFEPARRAGESVEATTTLRVTFRPGGPAGRGRSAYVTLGSASEATAHTSGFTTVAAKR